MEYIYLGSYNDHDEASYNIIVYYSKLYNHRIFSITYTTLTNYRRLNLRGEAAIIQVLFSVEQDGGDPYHLSDTGRKCFIREGLLPCDTREIPEIGRI